MRRKLLRPVARPRLGPRVSPRRFGGPLPGLSWRDLSRHQDRLPDPRRRRPVAMSMKELTYRADLACEDSSTIGYCVRWSFGGVGHRLDGRRLTFDDVFYSEALHVAGVFRARTADGTFESTWPSLTEPRRRSCARTGDLTWTAERVSRDRLSRMG